MNTPIETWIAQATHGLSEDSAARVRAEIEEHYWTAIASGANGDGAIAALGDPTEANRQYRKVLLTASEARLLHEFFTDFATRYPKQTTRWIVGIALVVVLGAVLVISFKDPWWFSVVATLVGWAFLELGLPIRTRLQGRLLRYLRWGVLVALALIGGNLGNLSPMFLMMLVDDYRRMVLRRKLPVEQWPKRLYF